MNKINTLIPNTPEWVNKFILSREYIAYFEQYTVSLDLIFMHGFGYYV